MNRKLAYALMVFLSLIFITGMLSENVYALPPTANNDTYVTNKNVVLIVPAINGVLRNDTDPENNPLTARRVTSPNPLHGVLLAFNPNGSFTFAPALNFVGQASFTYVANDGQRDSLVAVVNIKVNGPPVARNDGPYHLNRNVARTVPPPGVLANDTDPNGDPLIATRTPPITVGPFHGALFLNINGGFTYTPALNYVGSDSFTYRAYDGRSYSNVATVSLIVHGPPIAINDLSNGRCYRVNKNSLLNILVPGVLSNDIVQNGDPMTAIRVTNPAHGTVAQGIGIPTNGLFTYTPTPGYVGPDSFTYKARVVGYLGVNLDSNIARVCINVNGPPVAVNDRNSNISLCYIATKNVPLVVPPPGVLGNDTDPNGDPLTATRTPFITSGPSHGALVLNANGGFTYTPALNYVGSDSFTYRAYDGLLYSNVAKVCIKVNGPPVAVNDGVYNVARNGTRTVSVPGVLGNDTDPNGDSLTAKLVTTPSHGTLTPMPPGLSTNGSFTYTPLANYIGTDSFTYKAYDGSLYSNIATVSIRVNATLVPLANFPNPFNPETWIPYELSSDTNIDITIYSSSGQMVRRLDLGYHPAGSYIDRDKAAYWDGKNEAGEFVSSGIYFYTIKAGDFVATRKMVMMK